MATSTSRPLLLLGKSAKATKREDRQKHVPFSTQHSAERQVRVQGPKFEALRYAMEAERVKLQSNLLGADPELLIVLTIKGTLDDLFKTVKYVSGLEWLSSMHVENVLPDEEVFDADSPEKLLQGSIFLTALNHAALKQILSLWQKFQSGIALPKNFGPWKDLFLQLDDVRLWSPADRLSEGVRRYWEEMLLQANADIWFEIELTPKSATFSDSQCRLEIEQLVKELGGSVKNWCHLEEIGYHAALVVANADAVRRLLSDDLPAIAHCNRVWRFQPQARLTTIELGEEVKEKFPQNISPLELKARPLVAVLDGMPQENHSLLADRLFIEDPDEFASNYPVSDRRHGTSICSLVVWGALAEDGTVQHSPLTTPVYVRPIFEAGDKDFRNEQREERFPSHRLIIDVIHRAVLRIKKGDAETGATAATVKVINLSIGNVYAPFHLDPSPLARLLDWLSSHYRILFVVSAGNHHKELDIALSEEAFSALQPSDQKLSAWRTLVTQAAERRLLSPAEAVNALTVGALHGDNSPELAYLGDFFPANTTSPISAVGFGFNRSIKPELYLEAGRVSFRAAHSSPRGTHRISPARSNGSPLTGIRSATPGVSSPTALSAGTSNAAALLTRQAALILENLNSMRQSDRDSVPLETYDAVLVKALLVHCAERRAEWGEAFIPRDPKLGKDGHAQHKSQLARWFGYGVPDINRALSCTEQRATAIGVGDVSREKAFEFRFPLPPCLISQTFKRRLTITLAWFTPVNAFDQRYRRARLWVDPPKTEIGVGRVFYDHNQVQRGTVQHEVLEGALATPYVDGDSLVFKVNCMQDAGKLDVPVCFALCVSLEVAESIKLPIYQEVAARIAIRPGLRVTV